MSVTSGGEEEQEEAVCFFVFCLPFLFDDDDDCYDDGHVCTWGQSCSVTMELGLAGIAGGVHEIGARLFAG